MQYKAVLHPKQGEKTEQAFFASRPQAEEWAQTMLWARHRALVQRSREGAVPRELTGPRVEIHEIKIVSIATVYPWDVNLPESVS